MKRNEFRSLLNEQSDSGDSYWFVGPTKYDSVFFIHGFMGNSRTTWGDFPKLLNTDIELPKYDIHCWGYKSGFIPGNHADIELEGKGFLSEIRTICEENRNVIIISHSMGGLVTLKGIVDVLTSNFGNSVNPVNKIKHVFLYAVPLKGAIYANILCWTIGVVPVLNKVLPFSQARNLKTGNFVKKLLKDIKGTPVCPDVDGGIDVQACPAKYDKIVSAKSAVGVFKHNPPPVYLDGDHSSVKQPISHTDPRYVVFKKNIRKTLIESFKKLCDGLSDEKEIKRKMCMKEFYDRYSKLIEYCAYNSYKRNITDVDRRRILFRIGEFGRGGEMTPSEAAEAVIVDITYSL